MIIINSAAYIVPEFRTEFGKIPPCLLPLGNKKLLEYQVAYLRRDFEGQIVVSLPADYEMTLGEGKLFNELDITAVHVPVNISLAEAVLYVLNTSAPMPASLRLLHGDTLLESFPVELDCISVDVSSDDYNWESDQNTQGREVVWCGFFSFASPQVFVRCLALSRGDFVSAVRMYSEQIFVTREQAQGWHDLGHVNTYFISRSRITTQRIFNDLRIQDGIVWKSGAQLEKILAESEWFKSVPPTLKRFLPQLIDSGVDSATGNNFYSLEYLPMSPLNEVFVHGRNPVLFWNRIFDLTVSFLGDARTSFDSVGDGAIRDSIAADALLLFRDKTYTRLDEFSLDSNLNLDRPVGYGDVALPSIRDIAKHCIELTLSLPIVPTVLHGDLCFSNILYDSRSSALKVIDPRGMNQKSERTIYGDQKYDLAKVAHSVLGLYDFIIAGRYKIQNNTGRHPTLNFDVDERIKSIQSAFLAHDYLPSVTVSGIMPLTVLLFLSMLPLHSDNSNRQEAMLLNALRLYHEFI